MKKRVQANHQENPAHPNWINYLALIHAVTHPGDRDEPGRQLRKAHAPG